jgi:hypothetical protein
MRWPSFLLIGAAKSGTTAVYRYLQQHPQVFLSEPKEPRFFAFEGHPLDFKGLRGDSWRREFYTTRDRYLALFAGAGDRHAVGEASVMYLSEAGTAARIHRYVPEMKIMAILRDPVERAFSNFVYLRAEGRESVEEFGDALRAEQERRSANWISWFYYRGRGMYGEQLKPYYSLFDRKQIRVWLYEDLVNDPARMTREMFAFLGVDESFQPDFSQKHNVTRIPARPWLGALMKGRPWLDWLAAPKPVFPPDVRARLRESYREDLLLAEDLIGRDLSEWRGL